MPVISQNWKEYFLNHPTKDDRDKVMGTFNKGFIAGTPLKLKATELVEERDTVILITSSSKTISMLHSPTNFGGTCSRVPDKIACLLGFGFGTKAMTMKLHEDILKDCKTRTPKIKAFHWGTNAEDLKALVMPNNRCAFTYNGSRLFLPCPGLRNRIINAETEDPFELMTEAFAWAKSYNTAHA